MMFARVAVFSKELRIRVELKQAVSKCLGKNCNEPKKMYFFYLVIFLEHPLYEDEEKRLVLFL
jgi:hypothetical protein